MKSFTKILFEMYGQKSAYRFKEIIEAFSVYSKSNNTEEQPIRLYKHEKTVICSNHRWNGQKVITSMVQNRDGLVKIWIDKKYDFIHYTFLV